MSVIKGQHIYLPRRQLDLSKWAVIACDQFTKDEEYWQALRSYTSDSPTALDLIFPEIYLSRDNSERIKTINKNMLTYYQNGLLQDEGLCMILVNRSTKQHKQRLGIVMAVDLEEYSFKVEEPALIKASEITIIDRIPARVEIRKDAVVELPHILLFYDDRELKIAENLFAKKDELEKVYDFTLNMEGGHISGYKIKDINSVTKQFDQLLTPEYIQKTFNTNIPMLFAVGDGNHSLATAKEHWNTIKANLTEEEKIAHPARYVLVEAINIHDKGIKFSPIHRVVFNAGRRFLKGLKKLYKVNPKKAPESSYIKQKILIGDKEEEFYLPSNTPFAVKLVQDYINKCIEKRFEMAVDCVYDEKSLKEVCSKKPNSIGITLPAINKDQLFEFIIKHGSLPRKSFSIGEPREMRYYLEAHKIKLI